MQERDILPPDSRLELIRGELVEMSPIGLSHVIVVGLITKLLSKLAGEEYQVWVQSSFPLDDFSAPEPDIALVKWKGNALSTQPPSAKDLVLVIEVADSSLAFDRKVKAPLYAEFGIAEYWILDLQNQCIEQYWSPHKDGYRQKTIVEKGQPLVVPGLGVEVKVEELLGLG